MFAIHQHAQKLSLNSPALAESIKSYQSTLAGSIVLNGIGVHSGKPAKLTIKPAPQDTGYLFIRTDVERAHAEIPATWDRVVNTRMNTTLANHEGVQISTVEHVLAALSGCGVDNALLEIDGPEVPIMDGSSSLFVKKIQAIGLTSQQALAKKIRVLKPIQVSEGQATVFLLPADEARIYIQFNAHGRMPTQCYTFFPGEDDFGQLIGAARTFGFYEDAQKVRALGLAQGASLENTIVFDHDKILNPEGLRFTDECVRHKVLDAIGDLALAGGHLIAHYDGTNPGHSLNNKLLRTLFADPTAWRIEN
jgi:UDP-3-O-[3-hydroxymyristoyl] N-acetylglucosamine deacetylase